MTVPTQNLPAPDAADPARDSLPETRVPGTDTRTPDPYRWARRPNPARMYDYLLSGKSNYAVDRAAVDKIRAVLPDVEAVAWANRSFHQRAAIWMARAGIAQFIDVGCGLPTMRNTHEVVRDVNPAAKVAYLDHDPVVIAHARALLGGNGNTTGILADVRDPESLLTALRLDGLIEFAEPIGLLCTAVLHFVSGQDDPYGCIHRLVMALAPGSYVALSHVAADQMPPAVIAAGITAYEEAAEQVYPRSRAEVERFFTELELIPPYPDAPAELCRIGSWGAEGPEAAADDSSRPWWAGVGRKP